MAIIVIGKRNAKRRMQKMRERMANPNPIWPRVGNVISKEVRRQFSTKGANFGTPWRPLTPEYLAWKLSHGYPRQILVQTGEMRSTFTSRPMDIEEYRGQSARFGSSNQKAVWHHNGTHYRGKQVNPPRPILKATQPMAHDIAEIVGKYIVGRQGRYS